MNSIENNKIELINGKRLVIMGAQSLQELSDDESVILSDNGKIHIFGKNIEMISFNENLKRIEFVGLFYKIELLKQKEEKKKGFINKLIK